MRPAARAGKPLEFRFARAGRTCLLSNDFSLSARIGTRQLPAFAGGKALPAAAARELEERGFFRDRLDFEELLPSHFAAALADWKGPKVHIVSVTGACDHACAYCAASASSSGGRMTAATADRTVDFIFGAGRGDLVIEFQGGEPLSNFRAVRRIADRASSRAAREGRKLHFSIVSNLAGLDREKLDYICSRKIAVCTSLDGPAFVHDRHRRYAGGSSHAAAARGIAAVRRAAGRCGLEPPNAICTVTRSSLPYPREIVEEFLRQGIERVQLGPLEPLGRAAGAAEGLACTAAEFLAFYSKAFGHMLLLNRRGRAVYEKGALMFVKHILSGERPRYQNLDILFRLAYGPDGSVYGSDEARLLAAGGDPLFRLGSVREPFGKMVSSAPGRALLLSCFPALTQPRCARCPLSAWCRVSPVYNYSAQGGFWGDMMTSERCRIFMGVFDIIFKKLERPADRKILEGWAAKYQ